MSDFCMQYSIEEFGEDLGDLMSGKIPPEEKGWLALCEGCGPTLVDENGKCLADNCVKQHGLKKIH